MAANQDFAMVQLTKHMVQVYVCICIWSAYGLVDQTYNELQVTLVQLTKNMMNY